MSWYLRPGEKQCKETTLEFWSSNSFFEEDLNFFSFLYLMCIYMYAREHCLYIDGCWTL